MQILQNVPLALYSTMRLGGKAAYVTDVHSEDELAEALSWAKEHELPVIMVGGGSNIVWRDEGFNGLLIVSKIIGHEIIEKNSDEAIVKIGAGENWDNVVEWAVDQGLSGIETLSLIPGTAGATPVQNVEAYGEQIADTLKKVLAYDVARNEFRELSNADCKFGYRTSRFKNVDHGKFFICTLWLRLHYSQLQPPFHRGLQQYLDEHTITDFSPLSLRKAVVDIRSNKLPDPTKVANNGSFFKNPFVDTSTFDKLKNEFPDILHYPSDSGTVKLSAMWLIEHAGFTKGYSDPDTGMALWPKHTLVFVNKSAKNTGDLLKFRQKIVDAVEQKFHVTLEQEPELLP